MNKLFRVTGRMVRRYFSDGVGRASAQLAYYLFFSMFPILMLLNNLIGILDVDIVSILHSVENVLPQQVVTFVIDYLDYLGRVESPSVMFASVVLTVYALTRALNSLLTSVRQAYQIKQAGAVNYMTAAVLTGLILISFGLVTILILGGEFVLMHLEEFITIPVSIYTFLQLLKFIIMPTYMFFALSGFYYIVPSRRYKFKYAVPGAVFAVLALTILTIGFSYYVSNFSNYSLLYGSLAAVITLMIWLQLISSVLILGGVLNDVLLKMNTDR